MRYIDAERLIDDIRPFAEYDSNRSNKDWVRRFEIAIDAQPTADVVEVVRCKDCRWYERDIFDREAGVCFNPNKCTKTLGFEVLNEDYCSYGERADA